MTVKPHATTERYLIGGCGVEICISDSLPAAIVAPLKPFSVKAMDYPIIMHVEIDNVPPPCIFHKAVGPYPVGEMQVGISQDERGNTLLSFRNSLIDGDNTSVMYLEIKKEFDNFRISMPSPSNVTITQALPSVLMVAYSFAASYRAAALVLHASAIVYRGRAYLFLGSSGEGKSTHSQLWLRRFEECELLNDDNPVVRLFPTMSYAFGSPWSGKTPCYKQLCAPIGAVVRLRQATTNEIRPLRGVEAYAAILESCNTLRCNSYAYGAILDTAAKIAERVPVYELKNRPTLEAAELCRTTICSSKLRE